MYSYSMVQWLFFFYLYCFAGWCIESAYVSIRTRKLTNRGFMRGPFLPIYGSGAIMMLVVSMPFQDNIVMTYVAGCIGATVLEYVTGVTMELLFKMRYWDYSDKPLNFQGHICLGSTLSWGFLTILMTEIVHVPVERLVLSMPPKILAVVAYILTAGIFADFALSFKAAIDLRDVLVKMEQIKEEMMHIHGRLGAIVSRASQGMENYKTAFSESVSAAKGFGEGMAVRMEDLKSGIESKVELLKSAARTKPTAYLESVREEVLELVMKYRVNEADSKRLGKLKDFFQKDMIRSNPGMTSRRYQEFLNELKAQSGHKKKDKERGKEKNRKRDKQGKR